VSASRPRIAFVVPYGYPALAPGATDFGYVGGAEMQQARLARALAQRGHDVCLISADFGQAKGTVVDGVRVETAYRPFAGVPGLRFFHPRLTGLWSALDRADPAIVYQRAAGAITGLCALWARTRGRRFVFAAAHDFDALPKLPALTNPRDRALFRLGLRSAWRVLAQSEEQARAFFEHHGIRAAVVRNLIEIPAEPRPDARADAVVWLGTVKREKRPGWMVEAASRLPDVRFVVAGGAPPPPADDAELRSLRDAARRTPNLETPGFVEPGAVPGLLARARVFAHTSPAEGFPNTLLEAWAAGVPSVSAVDPDGSVSGGGAGLLAETPERFVAAVSELWHDANLRMRLGRAAREHVRRRHGPDAVLSDFERAVAPLPGVAVA
jgi:glycosyltransferase involved in cell wall biosynthesis